MISFVQQGNSVPQVLEGLAHSHAPSPFSKDRMIHRLLAFIIFESVFVSLEESLEVIAMSYPNQ